MLRARPGGPASGTTTSSIWSSPAGAYSRSAGATYEVAPGDLFFARPSQLIRYTADEAQPWEYSWVGFNGACANKLAAQLPFTDAAPRPPHPGPGGDAGGPEQHLLFPRAAAPGRGCDGGLSLPLHRRPDAGDQREPPPQHLFFQPVCPERHQVHPVQLLPRHLHRRCRQERRRLPGAICTGCSCSTWARAPSTI
ncbi:MAG: AraC family ligand binding domain-containing protein [Faecalibacterium sp.]